LITSTIQREAKMSSTDDWKVPLLLRYQTFVMLCADENCLSNHAAPICIFLVLFHYQIFVVDGAPVNYSITENDSYLFSPDLQFIFDDFGAIQETHKARISERDIDHFHLAFDHFGDGRLLLENMSSYQDEMFLIGFLRSYLEVPEWKEPDETKFRISFRKKLTKAMKDVVFRIGNGDEFLFSRNKIAMFPKDLVSIEAYYENELFTDLEQADINALNKIFESSSIIVKRAF